MSSVEVALAPLKVKLQNLMCSYISKEIRKCCRDYYVQSETKTFLVSKINRFKSDAGNKRTKDTSSFISIYILGNNFQVTNKFH